MKRLLAVVLLAFGFGFLTGNWTSGRLQRFVPNRRGQISVTCPADQEWNGAIFDSTKLPEGCSISISNFDYTRLAGPPGDEE